MSTQRKPQRIDDRRSYALKLKPGRDNDLIALMDRLAESGQIQAFLKAAARRYADLPMRDQTAINVERLVGMVEYLPTLLDEKLAGLTTATANGSEASPTNEQIVESAPILQADDLAQREAKLKKTKW